MTKIDLKKTDSRYYKAKATPELVQLAPYPYITIQGQSAPESPTFQESIECIYAAVFAVKKQYKNLEQDFVVPKMECLWWVDGALDFKEVPRNEWHWKIMIRLPEFVKENYVAPCFSYLKEVKGTNQAEQLHFETINEGLSVQILHIGSYEEEEENIAKLLQYMDEHDLEMNGYHHEIYISDPRKTATEKLKTILRYPVKERQLEMV